MAQSKRDEIREAVIDLPEAAKHFHKAFENGDIEELTLQYRQIFRTLADVKRLVADDLWNNVERKAVDKAHGNG